MVKDYKRRTFELMGARPGSHVLDVGCGRGDDVIALAQIVGADGRAVGVDRSLSMLETARAAARDANVPAEFIEGDATSLPFADAAFDACRMDRTLEHLSDPAGAVRELARVCKRGARVVIFEPDWDTMTVDTPDIATTRAVVAAHTDTFAHGTIGRSLRRLMVDAGLRDVRADPVAFGSEELGLADVILGLRQALIDGVKARRIDRASADSWWASLGDASAAGTFWATLSATMAVGTKP